MPTFRPVARPALTTPYPLQTVVALVPTLHQRTTLAAELAGEMVVFLAAAEEDEYVFRLLLSNLIPAEPIGSFLYLPLTVHLINPFVSFHCLIHLCTVN